MEDIKVKQSPSVIERAQSLRARISSIQYRENQDYYAISVNFIHNSNYFQSSSPKEINYEMYQEDTPISGRLKQGLRYKIDYQVVDQSILQEIQRDYECCIIRVGRNLTYGQRWLIYQQRVFFCFIDKNKYERQDQDEQLQCKPIELFPYNDTEHIRLMIVRAQGLPEYFCGRFSIYPEQLPKTYSKLKESLVSKVKLIPYFMLTNNPQIFRLKRKFKNYTILIEPQGQMILPNIRAECHNHVFKRAQYCCICQHQKSFSCDKYCSDNNKKHNNRCIYVKNKYSDVWEDRSVLQKLEKKKYMGLYNEQNMCFFNTVVQCLTHIRQLKNYFLARGQAKQLNYWNIDGTYGQVATQYARFVRQYFSTGDQNCNMPLFSTVGRWHPSYAGKHQQDSHQFLIKMLDWLKEDLNRNERKPPYKNIETSKKSQQQIQKQTLFVLKERNSSIIQQLMQGIQKSVIKCAECNSTSSTFDSFLTVQLAMSGQKKVEIVSKACTAYYISYMNSQKIKKIKIHYEKDYNLIEIKKKIKSSQTKIQQFDLDLYLVDRKGKVERMNSVNMHEILSKQLQNQMIYCVEKYRQSQKGQYVQVKLVFSGIESLPFSRPFFVHKQIEKQALYTQVLTYVYRCKNQNLIKDSVQAYIFKKFQDHFFPFDLVIRSKGEQTAVHRTKQYKRYPFQQHDTLMVKIRKSQYFDFALLNTCMPMPKDDIIIPKKKVTVVESTIEDCLRMYCKKEIIQDGRWDCPKCQIKRNAAKTLYFHKLPKILILSINRFKEIYGYSSSEASQFHKNENLIKYSEYLNMGKFTQNQKDQNYRLYAVANHIRLNSSLRDVQLMDGHYYAHIRLQSKWMKFDDRSVSQTYEDKVLNNKEAYILFYEKI